MTNPQAFLKEHREEIRIYTEKFGINSWTYQPERARQNKLMYWAQIEYLGSGESDY